VTKLLLINDNSAHPNWGAQATPFALREVLLKKIPDCEIRAIEWDWIRMERRAPKSGLLKRFEFRLDAIPHMAFLVRKVTRPVEFYPRVRDDFDWFADQWLAGRVGSVSSEYLKLVQWADVVVYNGENNLFRNTLEGCRSIFLAFLAKERLKKPVCAVNHTVHITGVRPVMKAMIQSVFPRLDLVTSREPRSYQAFRDLGVSNARSGADIVFALKETDEARRAVDQWLKDNDLFGKPFACVSSSGLPVSWPLNEHDGAMTELVRGLRLKLEMPIVLLARDPSCQFLGNVARRTGNPYFGPDHHFSELWPLFRNASVVVSGHYHYVIIAAISGCPFVPLAANNHKMVGVCEQLNWANTEPFDVTWLEPRIEDICIEARDVAAEKAVLGPALSKRSAELGQLAMSTGDWVRQVTEAPSVSDCQIGGSS